MRAVKRCKDVQLKYELSPIDVNTIIKPAVQAFTNQFKTQYKKEVFLIDQEDPSIVNPIPVTVKDQPKDVFSQFKIIHNLVNGKLK